MICNIRDAVFEVTRRCNLNCAHCERGASEAVDLKEEYVDAFLKQLNGGHIGRLTFSGGEPTLNPDIIIYTLEQLKKQLFMPGTISMITNGQVFNKELAEAFYDYAMAVKERYMIGDEFDINSAIQLGFSVDRFHPTVSKEVRDGYRKVIKGINGYDHTVPDEKIIKTGNATFGREFEYWLPNNCYVQHLFDENADIQGVVYLTATGYLTSNCEGTYVDMDELNYGLITEISLEDVVMNYFRNTDSFFPDQNLGKSPLRVMRRHTEGNN